MEISLEEALLTVYEQSLIENKKTVTLEDHNFPVRSTAKRKLKQIDFQFDGRPATSRTEPRYEVAGQRSETGKKQCNSWSGESVAVGADGKVHLCPKNK